MKVVFIKNNCFDKYKLEECVGYKFKPRRKNINSLVIKNNKLTKNILTIRLKKDIDNIEKSIKLMIKSNITETSDCIIMDNEIKRIIKNINNKYLNYFNEFEYFDYIKKIYVLNNVINLKKMLIDSEEL